MQPHPHASPAASRSRQSRSPVAQARGRRRTSSAALAAVLIVAAARPSAAMQLESEDGLITQTVAGADRLKNYDPVRGRDGIRQVKDLKHSEFEPIGVRLGNFVFYPSLGTVLRFDDNLFAKATDRVADLRSELSPHLLVVSSMPRHALRLSLGGKIVNHMQHDELDYASGQARVSGALHFDHAHTLSAEMLTSLENEEPSDPGAPLSAARPIEVWRNRASLGITRDVGRLYGTFSTTAESWDYRDTRDKAGNVVDQDGRDAQALKAQLRMGYRFSPGFEVQTKLKALRIWNVGVEEADRDSVGYEALIGLAGEFNPLVTWKLLAGYGIRNYDRVEFGSTNAFLFEGQITWLITPFLTLHGLAERSVAEVLDGNGQSVIETAVSGKAEYEVWHNVVLSAGGEVRRTELDDGSRTDHTLIGRLGAEYHASRNWLFTFGYEYQDRLSTNKDNEMIRNRLFVGAKLRF